MKSVIFAIVMTLGFMAQAGRTTNTAKAKDIIKTGNEPALYIKAFEARGTGLKCNPIKDEEIKLGKITDRVASATINVFCNEYDAEGMPLANVYILNFQGSVYIDANFFNIDSMKILPQE